MLLGRVMVMSDIEREEFEQAVTDRWSDSYSFTRFGDEDYFDEIVEGMWRGWQASRQALEGEPLEVWLGNGDKIVADIYAHNCSFAGIGIFEPEKGMTMTIGESDGKIDGSPLEDTNAIVLIKSTQPESLQVVVEELQEAMAKMGYTHPASAEVERLQARVVELVAVAVSVRDDLLLRSEIDSDGTRCVNLSASKWSSFCDVIDDNNSEAFILRKQAEAVEAIADGFKECGGAAKKLAMIFLNLRAKDLRDEAEKAGAHPSGQQRSVE